jgi:hypothetical protein
MGGVGGFLKGGVFDVRYDFPIDQGVGVSLLGALRWKTATWLSKKPSQRVICVFTFGFDARIWVMRRFRSAREVGRVSIRGRKVAGEA